jgi:hypothetical protein
MRPLFEMHFLIYLKMTKNSKQKYFVYISILYVSIKSFQEKPTFYKVDVKMTKFDTKTSLFVILFFVKAMKNICFS